VFVLEVVTLMCASVEEKNGILCTCKNLYGVQTNLEVFQLQRAILLMCIEFIGFKLLSKD
jgi:hypothetical protein